jgi:ABC-type Co2+ transport system permease subunit
LLVILMSFEAMVATSFVAILVAGFLNVAGATDAVVMLGATAVAVVFLSVLHSYLLLVRFSAIAIMRRNVVEV